MGHQSKTRTKGIYEEVDGSRTISKTYRGERIFKRLGQISQAEAEAWLHNEINSRKQAFEREKSAQFLFADCAQRYLEESIDKASVETMAYHVSELLPFIGHLEIELIHDGTLQPFIAKRGADGVSNTTINRALEVVDTVLNKAARVYRDRDGRPWLKQAPPKITKLQENRRKPRPISFEEQDRLISELPDHLVPLVLFAVNTGLRNQNICGLRWHWEHFIPELDRSVFVIPPEQHKTGKKSGRKHVVILNDLAWQIVNEQRGKHDEYVFVHSNNRRKPTKVDRFCSIYNSAWKSARIRAKLENVRVHDLRHTYGMRLRAVGASEENRGALLGHATRSMTDHYAAPHFKTLLEISNKVLDKTACATILNLL